MWFRLLSFILINSTIADYGLSNTNIKYNIFSGSKIIGGTVASITDFPFQVSLENNGRHICGGSIISQIWVLSAAHCMQYPKESMTVYVGSENLLWNGYTYGIDLIILHEKYDSNWYKADLALIKVNYPFIWRENVKPIQLFNQDEFAQPNKLAKTSGWGKGNEPYYLLHSVTIFIVSREECAKSHKLPTLPPGQICAGVKEGGKDSCAGDSGGPLIMDGKLAGIVSWGVGCGFPNIPGVYTEVARYRSWIRKIANV